jgi:HEPN domain-containing protein
VGRDLSWLFRKRESAASKKAKQNVELCEKAVQIVRKCDSIGDKEIRQLAKTLNSVNPDIDEAWVRKIVDMANLSYLSYANRMISSGQKPLDSKKYVKETMEAQLRNILAMWQKMARSLQSA